MKQFWGPNTSNLTLFASMEPVLNNNRTYFTYSQIHEPFHRVRVTSWTPSCPGGRVFPLHQRQFSVHADHLPGTRIRK